MMSDLAMQSIDAYAFVGVNVRVDGGTVCLTRVRFPRSEADEIEDFLISEQVPSGQAA